MDGLFDDVITANRDLIREFTYLETDENGIEGDPIDLTPYTRLVYNMQTGDATPVEILTVDSDDPDQDGWLTIQSPATDGVILLSVPGSALTWVPSDRGKWEHEMVLLDDEGGILPFFKGGFLYKKPAIIFT